jgi:STE24 endopeptidase
MNLFIILLTVFISVPFVIDIVVALLNKRNKTVPIPQNVKDVYNEKQYQKWVLYETEKFNKKLVYKSISLILKLSILLFGGLTLIETISTKISSNIYVINILILVFYGILLLIGSFSETENKTMKIISGILLFIIGAMIMRNPIFAGMSLAIWVAVLLLIAGIYNVIISFSLKKAVG